MEGQSVVELEQVSPPRPASCPRWPRTCWTQSLLINHPPPIWWKAILLYSLSRSTSQAGELPHVAQNMLNSITYQSTYLKASLLYSLTRSHLSINHPPTDLMEGQPDVELDQVSPINQSSPHWPDGRPACCRAWAGPPPRQASCPRWTRTCWTRGARVARTWPVRRPGWWAGTGRSTSSPWTCSCTSSTLYIFH